MKKEIRMIKDCGNSPTNKEEILITTKYDAFRDLLLIKETRSNGEVWFKVPNSVASPDIILVIEDLKNQIVKLENSCDEDEKAVQNHFKNFLKEIVEYQLKNGTIITSDNIHLYYEFMSDDYLIIYKQILDAILVTRKNIINGILFSAYYDRFKGGYTFQDIGIYRVKQSLCGLKDTLKPIDEYISQIKDSEDYRAYIANSANAGNVFFVIISESTCDLALSENAFILHMEAVRTENVEHFEDYHLDSHKHWDRKKIETLNDAKLYFIEAMQGDSYSQFYEIDFNSRIVSSMVRNVDNDQIAENKTKLSYSKAEIIKQFPNKYKENFLRAECLKNDFSFMVNVKAL